MVARVIVSGFKHLPFFPTQSRPIAIPCFVCKITHTKKKTEFLRYKYMGPRPQGTRCRVRPQIPHLWRERIEQLSLIAYLLLVRVNDHVFDSLSMAVPSFSGAGDSDLAARVQASLFKLSLSQP